MQQLAGWVGGSGLPPFCLLHLLLVLQRGRVAMMAVGDVDGLGAHQVDDLVLDLGVDHAPQVVLHAVERAATAPAGRGSGRAASVTSLRGSVKSPKIGESCMPVARISFRRSSIGPL